MLHVLLSSPSQVFPYTFIGRTGTLWSNADLKLLFLVFVMGDSSTNGDRCLTDQKQRSLLKSLQSEENEMVRNKSSSFGAAVTFKKNICCDIWWIVFSVQLDLSQWSRLWGTLDPQMWHLETILWDTKLLAVFWTLFVLFNCTRKMFLGEGSDRDGRPLTGTMLRYAAARFAYSFSRRPIATQMSSESAYSAILKASVYISMDFVHSPSLNTSFPSPKRFHTRSLMNTWKKNVRNQIKSKTENSRFVFSIRRCNTSVDARRKNPTSKRDIAYLILLLTSRIRKRWPKSQRKFMLRTFKVSAEQKEDTLEWE